MFTNTDHRNPPDGPRTARERKEGRHELCSLTAAGDDYHVWTVMVSKQQCALVLLSLLSVPFLIWVYSSVTVRKWHETAV